MSRVWEFLAVVVAVALTLHAAVVLIRPVVPYVVVLSVCVVALRLTWWWTGRW